MYDKRDRLVLSQDGNQASGSKWGYCLYDNKNRVTESGEVVLSGKTHIQLQNEAGSSDNYTPAGTCVAYQYTVYDNYITTSGVIAHPFVVRSDYATGYHPLITGMVTSVRNRVVGTDTLLTTINYYDDRCRLVYSVSDNLFGRKSHLYKKYDFVGNVLKQCEIHEISATRTDVFEVTNVYDNRSRILSSSARLNNGTPVTISYSYDAFGRLVKKTYGTLAENLSYNIRGWLTGKSSVPFSMQLRYDQVEGGSTARLNGNISEWEWQQGSSAALMYGFSYDGVNRLTSSVQKQKSGSWQALSADYVEKEISYDRNGNLKTLQRTAGGSLVDNLAYSYTGNRLTGLSEKVRSALSGDIFAPGSSESGSYTYDNNGNMLTDSRRGLIIGYNFLNLVNQVKAGTTVKATYRWLSDGTKLRVFSPDGNGYYYLGSLTYKTDASGTQLETASFGEGVIRPKSSGQELNYFLTDHLGSVRVIADGNGTVLERNDYYPFGAVQAKGYPQNNNRLKYNGKEKQTTGAINYLDYGARMYDAGVGRWFGMDPGTESNFSLSSYHFCRNNPLLFIDPNGELETHYVDEDYNVILQTNDGSDDVVQVPRGRMSEFLAVVGASMWDRDRMNSTGWNNYWKNEFGLANFQLSAEALMALEQFNTKWSRNNAVRYFLKPTLSNAFRMGWSEGLSQWTNPEIVLTGLSFGIVDWENVLKGFVRNRSTIGIKNNLTVSEIKRIENAATRIGKEIHLVGSRAKGTATSISDWDYVIEEINRKSWNKIKNSLPGSKSIYDNTFRNIDLIRGPLDATKPHITFNPRKK